MSLPATHRALVVRDVNVEPKIETLPVPDCLPGTVILKVIASSVISYTRDVFLGNKRNYTYPLPIIPGSSCIGRVAALPADATSENLVKDTLVFFNCFVRSRVNDTSAAGVYLQGLHDGYSTTSKALMAEGGCKDGSYAEYIRVPVESIYILNEAALIKSSTMSPRGLDYSPHDLCHITRFLVPYGGLRSINILPGESILVGPATGGFGDAAVILALQLGAKVVAWGRKESKMTALKSKVESLQSGRFARMFNSIVFVDDPDKDVKTATEANMGRRFDAAFDITPPAASGSSYIKSAILSLRPGGRISLMGGIRDDVAIPHNHVMHQDITIKGKWMYDRQDVLLFMQLVENGVVRLDKAGSGSEIVGIFGLRDWKTAWDQAFDCDEAGKTIVIAPTLQ